MLWQCIRFWNTQTASPLNCVDTGSQVCNLCWSKNINELVSTHGYSQNQIVVWRYSSMSKVASLTLTISIFASRQRNAHGCPRLAASQVATLTEIGRASCRERV